MWCLNVLYAYSFFKHELLNFECYNCIFVALGREGQKRERDGDFKRREVYIDVGVKIKSSRHNNTRQTYEGTQTLQE